MLKKYRMENSNNNILTLDEHLNLPQLLVHLIGANHTIGEWGRGTGKSTGAVAPRMVHLAKVMPGMAGTFLAPSFRKFTDHMWPGIKKGFTEKMKLVEGRDFVCFKRPPEHWGKPFMAPKSFDHFVSFRNGSGFHIISFDHSQTANGLDTDANITDEAKLIDGERAQEEVFNTLRGNRDKFGHLPEHYSKWIFSDKYIKPGSKQNNWYNAYKAQNTPDIIEQILLTLLAIQQTKSSSVIAKLKMRLVELRKQCVYYTEASTVDNIHAVGIEYIEGLAKTNSAYGILTSIFNMEVKRGDESYFYPMFNEHKHTYESSDNARIDELLQIYDHETYLSKRSSALDNDVIKTEKLKVFLDLGGTYNWALVAQKKANTVKFLKNFSVQKPRKLIELATDIASYYLNHSKKYIELYWPKDGENETYVENRSDIERFISHLESLGWVVEDKMPTDHKFIPHKLKYDFGCYVFDYSESRDNRFPFVMFNASNCSEAIWSISNAKLVPGEEKRRKDKRGEKNHKLPQWQQTHYSDAFDWLIIDYLDLLQESTGYSVSLH